MASQRARPRLFMCSMLEGSGKRVGLVFREDAIDEGSSARKAFNMLMVRGICNEYEYTALSHASGQMLAPLKPMHFRPISRMNSAIATPSLSGLAVAELLYRAIIDSGEFIVMVAAVEMPSHDGRPSLRSVASCSIRLYTACILGGAGTGPGRECAALMSDLSVGDSFDMVTPMRARGPR